MKSSLYVSFGCGAEGAQKFAISFLFPLNLLSRGLKIPWRIRTFVASYFRPYLRISLTELSYLVVAH